MWALSGETRRPYRESARRQVGRELSERGGFPGRAFRFVRRDIGLVGQGQGDVVEAFEETPARVVVDVEGGLDRVRAGPGPNRACGEVDGDRRAGLSLEQVPQPLHDLVVDLRGEQARFAGVAP